MNDRVRAIRELVSIFDLLEERGIFVASRERKSKLHCPVHDDSHKSAVVYPESGEIYCFAEDRTYDVVSLVAEWEGLEWWEACAWLEDRVGVVYERQSNPQDEFWRLARSRGEEVLSARQALDLRWEIHRTVLEVSRRSGVEVDWDGFDGVDVGLDIGKLRAWQERYVREDFGMADASGRGEALGRDSGVGVASGERGRDPEGVVGSAGR